MHVPSAQVASLRDTLSRRRHFVRVQTAEINAAKRLLRSAGLGWASRDLRSERGWATVLQAVAPYGELRASLEQHRALWRCAGEQIQALETLLAAHQRQALSAQAGAPATWAAARGDTGGVRSPVRPGAHTPHSDGGAQARVGDPN